VITGFTAVGQLAEWVAAGVDGLFLKTCPPEEMKEGFSLILHGGSYYFANVMQLLKNANFPLILLDGLYPAFV